MMAHAVSISCCAGLTMLPLSIVSSLIYELLGVYIRLNLCAYTSSGGKCRNLYLKIVDLVRSIKLLCKSDNTRTDGILYIFLIPSSN